jgi:hypothetical protein
MFSLGFSLIRKFQALPKIFFVVLRRAPESGAIRDIQGRNPHPKAGGKAGNGRADRSAPNPFEPKACQVNRLGKQTLKRSAASRRCVDCWTLKRSPSV